VVEDPALTESLGAGSAAASTEAEDVSAAAVTESLCYSQVFGDPNEADDALLDATSYEMGFDCEGSYFFGATTTVDTWEIEGLYAYEIDIDTNGNLNDGCFGADYIVGAGWNPDPGVLVGGLFRTRSCDDWTLAGEVGVGRPTGNPGNQIAIGFPGALFRNTATMRWQQWITHWDANDPLDYMPDGYLDAGNYRSTPGNPCGGRCFYLTNGTTGGPAEVVFRDTQPASEILVGDWDGDGVDSFGFRSGSSYAFKNSHAPTPPDMTVSYGRAGDVVLVGDWDGDGDDTLAVRRGNTYYIKNSFTGGPADITVAYGRPSDVVLVGDWNGDGTDTLAVRRGSTYYIKNSFSGGAADITVGYGRATDIVLVGDWNGDGTDTLAVRRGNTYYLKNSFTGGAADITFAYGTATDITFVGDWNGDGLDTLGVRR
jgi:hypothetical protein